MRSNAISEYQLSENGKVKLIPGSYGMVQVHPFLDSIWIVLQGTRLISTPGGHATVSVLPGCFIDIKTTEGIFTRKRLKISQLYRSMEGNLRKWIPDSNP